MRGSCTVEDIDDLARIVDSAASLRLDADGIQVVRIKNMYHNDFQQQDLRIMATAIKIIFVVRVDGEPAFTAERLHIRLRASNG